MKVQRITLSRSNKIPVILSIACFIGTFGLTFGFYTNSHFAWLFLLAGIGFSFYACNISVKNDEEAGSRISKLTHADSNQGIFAGALVLTSTDTGEAMMIATVTGEIRLYAIKGRKLDIFTFHRDEIKKITVYCQPRNFGVTKDSSSLLKLTLAGTVVGGAAGFVMAGIFTSLVEDYKTYTYQAYNFLVRIYLRNGKRLEFRAIKRACAHHSTPEGQQQITQVLQEADRYLGTLNQHFSDKLEA